VIPVLVEQAGQAGAINAGVARTTGEVVLLLDADDAFAPGKVPALVDWLRAHASLDRTVLVCHPMTPIDADSTPLGGREPLERRDSLAGNLYEFARRNRYLPFAGAPTSGLALTRPLVDQVFPLRTAPDVTHGADDLIVRASSLLGEVRWIDEELGLYRRHGSNAWGRGRPRSEAFHRNQDAYLNDRLRATGREPVIDFFSSEYARTFYLRRGDRRGLAALAARVVRQDPGMGSLAFAARTLLSAIAPGAAPAADRAERARLEQEASSVAGR
jgi:glycosyltransferase involved in cell wall biosynthesis